MGSKKRKRIRNAKRAPMRFIRVTSTAIYAFEERSINGWHPEQVIESWFENYPPDSYHATRDTHKVGGSTVVKTAKVITSKQVDQYFNEIKNRRSILKTREYIFDGLTTQKAKKLAVTLKTIPGVVSVSIFLSESVASITYDKKPSEEYLEIAAETAGVVYRCFSKQIKREYE